MAELLVGKGIAVAVIVFARFYVDLLSRDGLTVAIQDVSVVRVGCRNRSSSDVFRSVFVEPRLFAQM